MPNLIFDFDGVIGNTTEAAILAHMQFNQQPTREAAIDTINHYCAHKPNHTRDHTLTETELADAYKWTAGFGQAMHEIGFELFNDFVNEIESIESHNKAVVSSGSQIYVLPALVKTNIAPTHILAFEDHHSKEEKIEIICKDWGVNLDEVHYFTDTLADIYELQNFIAKDKLIGVTWGFCTKEQLLTELLPEHILNNP